MPSFRHPLSLSALKPLRADTFNWKTEGRLDTLATVSIRAMRSSLEYSACYRSVHMAITTSLNIILV